MSRLFVPLLLAASLLSCEALVHSLAIRKSPTRSVLLRLSETSPPPDEEPADEAPVVQPAAEMKKQGMFDGSTTVGSKTIPLPPAVLIVGVSVGFCVVLEVVKFIQNLVAPGSLPPTTLS